MNPTKMQASPRLRFPEFAGHWQTLTLRDHGISVIDGDRGKNYPNGDDFSANGYCLFLNAKNVASSGFVFSDVSFISEEKDRQLSKGKLEAEDVVLTTRGTVGNIAFFGRDIPYRQMRINSGMVLLRCSDKKISPQFLYSAFFAPPLDGDVKRTAFGSAQPQLTVKGIYALKFGAPAIPEQQKIGDFLTAVDGRIQQLSQKKAPLQDYKKGVMQQLFTQALRFKDDHGNDFPDWEEKTVDDVADCLDNLRRPVNSADREKMKGEIPYYGANGIQGYVNDFLFDDDLTLLAEDGGNFDDFAPRPIAQRVCGKAWVNNHAHILRAKATLMTPDFLFYCLVHKDIRRYINGSSRAKLNKGDMLTIKVAAPSVAEQTKIANFLTALDRKIESVSQQITHTQTFKRGLLQQMFV
ncbi:restriction endonuclease subunit S [Fuerstiella marisgermanici]|uniref:Type I restriction modification DNA specificity domain protein n=1 Tax=Fuerstiella marisgermanici TaxID=1891926 RepID=A0A1P8WLN4_9PLAN|nr:restriction endonuclease subunit S [Fuerstiella marisgermanici]APZ94959.1 Type I restriction modification DNA specificity domain protein [Fuerstiella marisgermanici]